MKLEINLSLKTINNGSKIILSRPKCKKMLCF